MKKAAIALLGLAALLAAGWLWWQYARAPRDNGEPADPAALGEQLEWMRRALAETENLNSQQAIPLWQRLVSEAPDELDHLQNLVVARLSRLQQLKAVTANATAPAEQRAEAEAAIPTALEEASDDAARLLSAARQTDEAARVNDAVWLAGQIEAFAAGWSGGSDRAAEMEQMTATALRVAEQLRAAPEALPLVGLLEETAALAQDPLAGPTPELARVVAASFFAANEARPRNLITALRALEYGMAAEDRRVIPVLERLREQIQPLDTLIRQRVGNLDVTQLIESAIADVEAARFADAQRAARLLQNALNGTAAYRSDMQRTKPHPLDLVATRRFNEVSLAAAAASSLAPSSQPLRFAEPVTLGQLPGGVTSLNTFDVDLDERTEIVATSAGAVFVFGREDEGWRLMSSREVPGGVRGCTVTDLFLADGDAPRKLQKQRSASATGAASEVTTAQGHDVFPSLLTWGASGVQIVRFDGRAETADAERLLPVQEETGLESLGDVLALTPFDLDADGDLDLAISSVEQGLRLFVNRDNMTFYEVTQYSRLPAASDPVVDMALVDWDRDLALDLLTIQRSGKVGWLRNLLHFQMQWMPLEEAATVGTGRSIAAAEWDGNVSWDAVYGGGEGIGLLLTETTGMGRSATLANVRFAVDRDRDAAATATSVVADLDNDSWLDVLVTDQAGARVLAGGPRDDEAGPPLFRVAEGPVAAAAVGELSPEAGLDVCLGMGDRVVLFANVTQELGRFIKIQMTGIFDNATGRVNHYAIGSTHELRLGPHYRAAVVNSRTTHFGIGRSAEADTLRTILTNGVTQNVIDPATNETLVEDQSLKGSCPYLYAWDGERFRFVTDCLWAAPLGLQSAMGRVTPDRPWEYLKVDGTHIRPRDGHYELRLTEELWEIAYFDHVSLIAVDHPADVEIWTNEKVGPPEVVGHRVFAFKETRPLAGARDTQGDDCAELLAARDERYVRGFDARYLQGLCPPHWIDLDLGPVEAEDRVYLLLTGWILPTDTSLNIRIDQNPRLSAVEPPSVWVPARGDDDWEMTIPAMGFPGGKTKTIVVDLTGKFNAEDPRVRIRTSAQIYWDAAEVVVNPPAAEAVTTPLDLVSAEVGYHGFSAELPRSSDQPERYDYQRASQAAKWPPLAGGLTRFGDVRELLAEWDDEMVVISGGDEIRLRFRVPPRPLPEGWQRDFILHSVGWDKDADLNTLAGQSVDPLPFRTMAGYPPRGDDAEAALRVEELNRWHRTRYQPFRAFWQR